jgi:cyanophycinase
MNFRPRFLLAAAIFPAVLHSQNQSGAPRVGPAKGTVIVVGGGGMGPEVYDAFIKAAGGPDALILTVPNAGGAATYPAEGGNTRSWRNAGAKNVAVLFTKDRKLADTDSFVAIIKKAGGIWFEGGRQWHIYNDYAGTKTEAAFNEVLARGGVVGGSSAGASILGDFLVRGAPSNDNMIMDHPQYQKGFAYLRGTGVDQHVVARSRLPDLADSIIPKYPSLLGISEDEGTAWFIQGDTGTIIGRNKAFAYGANVKNDPNKPFITLHPGDKFNLNTRQVISRAIDGTPLTLDFVNSLFTKYSDPALKGASVLVAQDGKVLVDRAYGIPVQPRLRPETGVSLFTIGDISDVFTTMCAQIAAAAPPDSGGRGRAGGGAAVASVNDSTVAARAAGGPPDTTAAAGRAGRAGRGGGSNSGGNNTPSTPLQNCTRQLTSPVGMQLVAATPDGQVNANVDDLYRFELGLQNPRTYNGADRVKGWTSDAFRGVNRMSAYALPGGKRSAYVRIPDRKAVIIVLTNDDNFDAKGIADRISERLIAPR